MWGVGVWELREREEGLHTGEERMCKGAQVKEPASPGVRTERCETLGAALRRVGSVLLARERPALRQR